MARSRFVAAAAVLGLAAALIAVPRPAAAAAPSAATPAAPSTATPAAPSTACHPTAAHPYPVVLVHGTFGSSAQWDLFAPTLTAQGYCVFRIDYGTFGTADIRDSAAQLASFVTRTLAATGAAKVDLVGHSQGGMMPRYYLKYLGGAAKVHRLVALAPSNHGTTLDGLALLAAGPGNPLGTGVSLLCPACVQQIIGSAFLTDLNRGGDTVPGVLYTVIATRDDRVVTPYTNTFLTGGAVVDLRVQDACPLDRAGHIALAVSDPNAWQLVYDALDPAHARPVFCLPQGPSL